MRFARLLLDRIVNLLPYDLSQPLNFWARTIHSASWFLVNTMQEEHRMPKTPPRRSWPFIKQVSPKAAALLTEYSEPEAFSMEWMLDEDWRSSSGTTSGTKPDYNGEKRF